MNEHILEALSAECERTGAFFDSLQADEWHQPTRCPPLDLFQLGVHAYRGSRRIVQMIDAGPRPEEAEKSAITYFQYDAAAEAPVVVRRAQETSQDYKPETFAATWHAGWDEAFAKAAPALGVDAVYDSVFGRMHLSDYLKTRIVEVTIHAMDLRHALNLSPDPTEQGLTACCDVLRGLLGADVRPLGIDDVRFAETATGRATLDDAEREILGPLAALFPVLA